MTRPPWLALAVVLVATGCNPPEDVEPLACLNDEAGEATLGTGDLNAGFTALEDGDPLLLVFGPQGMHMVVVSVRVENMETSAISGLGSEVAIGLYEADEVIGGTIGALTPVAGEGGSVEFLGIRAIITAAEVEDVGNQEAWVEATVVDGCGRELTTGKNVWLTL